MTEQGKRLLAKEIDKPLRVLNLYAGIGGNRKLWQNVDVTAVEYDEKIAAIYKDFFPNDKVIVGDAHKYLLEHFAEYDFIWSSPPCPTHSKARYWGSFREDTPFIYPDMTLYQEIIFLKHFAGSVLWVIENVQPYYEPLIPAKNIGRHLFWSNFPIPYKSFDEKFKKDSVNYLAKLHGFDLTGYKINKQKVLRNCVLPQLGLHVYNAMRGELPPIQEGLFAEVS